MVSTSVPRNGAADRLALDRLVGGEVAAAERAAVLDHEVARAPPRPRRGRTAPRPSAPNRSSASASSGKRKTSPSPQRPPAGRVELARARQPLVDRGEDVEDVGLLGVDRRPLAGQPDAGADQVGERHRAEALQRLRQAGGGSRHPAGGRADVERLRRLGVEVDRHRRPARRARSIPSSPGAATKKSISVVSPPRVDHHVAAGAEPGQRALDREGGEHRADRGVDRVAAFAQDPGTGLGGQRMPGCDDPVAWGALV